ncbi:hypothetical protein DPEC_G00209690 [Dallia pectoralis]|uniref:Uncharacterized protein n=1 Tax=Dallia pectoralis TaxID=75939 RepID=A0ACC2G5I0_DALPE|nr:hypothetical protein DPEC_G00209690 [Dallia pectoralis]
MQTSNRYCMQSSLPKPKQTNQPQESSTNLGNLLDKDTFSKSDPLCVLYTQGVETKQWREFGRTEVIDNTLNPDFVRKYILDYFFEEKQNLRFDLYDVDSKSPDLSKHDFLGQVFCTLGEIVGSPASRLEKPLGKPCVKTAFIYSKHAMVEKQLNHDIAAINHACFTTHHNQ